MTNVKDLRTSLHLTQQQLADLIGADVRSVVRWETSKIEPCGAPLEIMHALDFFSRKKPEKLETLLKLIQETVLLGGLSYFLFRLMDEAT